MAITFVEIPLFPDPAYSMSINLEGNSYKVEIIYNTRMALYTISLYDVDDQPIVMGEALVPEYPIFADYALPNLSGAFALIPKETVQSTEPYKQHPMKLSEYYNLVYLYDKE